MRCIIVLLVLAALPTSAFAADCTMAQLQISPFSVIEPCTEKLQAAQGLGDLEKSAFYFVRGRGYHRTKRLDEARTDYAAAFRLNPKNEEILLSWSNIELRQRHGRDYMARVEQAYALNPNNPHVLRAQGGMASNFGDNDKAMEFYARALSIDPAEPFVLYDRSDLYLRHRKFKEAIADADALVAVPRKTLDEYGFLDTDGVMKDFHVAALLKRGKIHEAAGRLDLAIMDLDAAVAEERSPRTLLPRGWLLRSFPERKAEVLADLTAAVQLEPGNAPAQYGLGIELIGMKRFEEAFLAFDAAVEADPARGMYLLMRARMHRQFDRTDDAVTDLETAYMRDPEETIEMTLRAFQRAGYWTSKQAPNAMSPELRDAIRACMLDLNCN
jgi:tetratricopeptide (TPR) repeat protein